MDEALDKGYLGVTFVGGGAWLKEENFHVIMVVGKGKSFTDWVIYLAQDTYDL